MKEVKVSTPKRIDLNKKPIKTVDILYKKVFGLGKVKTQGTGAATQGIRHNADWSGKE
jgi:hypothetical protein|tara:strand:+ start:5815 stop:5988 length:174 start_codon:yes stop_codon:yes gene_type:complete